MHKRVVVVGAGVAGLTLSYKLSSTGHDVLLVEKERSVGGLARSYAYPGGFTFDPGPHRFHTDSPAVLDFILQVLDDDYLRISRKSGVRMFDRCFDWPLTTASIFRMPLAVLLSVGGDLLSRKTREGPSFKDYILNRYGKTLYEIFFKPYTEKFLGVPCSEVSRDWAVTGIDRAVIDSTVKMDDLLSLTKSLLRPRPPLEFLYPKSGGIGAFAERLKSRILGSSGTLLLGSEITGIRRRNNVIEKVVIGEREYDCDLLVWTGPLKDLSHLLGLAGGDLQYLSLLLYNFCLDSTAACQYQWCYFGAADVPFNRVSIPVLFNPSLAPAGKAGICVEVTCRTGDPAWQAPETLEHEIRRALTGNEIVRQEKDIAVCHIERLANAYPVYTLDYAEKVAHTMAALARFENLRLLGRTGTFWYNNMDHSIGAALKLFSEITA